jgi:hypothetical protein
MKTGNIIRTNLGMLIAKEVDVAINHVIKE